jgi:hypothetical protein
MIFFEELAHNNSNPIPSLTDNNLTLFNMLSPGPPLPLNFSFNIIDKDFGYSNGIGIVVDLVADTNDGLAIIEPGYFLHVVCLDIVGLFVRKSQLVLELLD